MWETRALHAEFVGLLADFGLDTVGIFRELSESQCDKVFLLLLNFSFNIFFQTLNLIID